MKFSLLALLATTSLVAGENVVQNIQQELSYDENGKLSKHYLVYPAGNPNCPAASHDAGYLFESAALDGEALQAVFPGYEGNGCRAACLELGTDRSVAHAVMPHKQNFDADEAFGPWFANACQKVELCLLNYHSRDYPLKLMWLSPDTNEEQLHMEIEWGERKTRCFESYIGHKLIARDGNTNEVVYAFTVEHVLSMGIGESPPSGNPEGHNIEQEIESTLHKEWEKTLKIKRTFSPLGFKKARLPEDVFAMMGAFYYNNRHNNVREEWDGKGVFVNWWETDPTFIQIPWETKRIWQVRLKELVEAWARVPIEQTDMYGLRQYEEGSRLLTHVDRETTHAVSLIVNIAQGNMTEPWPVEVHDHAYRLHEVLMQPGDIVYYESAKALHGRNRPLKGDNAYYVNLFTHYRPVGDPRWMEKPNTPGTPEPLIEVEGECRLEEVSTAELPGKKLGIVQAVKCDDERLGDTVSPALFTAGNGHDLIDWWRKTGPPPTAQS